VKPISPELLALLATRQFFAADLFTLTLQSGVSLYYCGGDADIVANGITFSAGGQTGPYWDRTDNKAKCHWKVGVDVDSLVIDVIPGSATILGVPFLTAIRNGVFDGAEFTLDKVFMPTYGDTSRGFVRYFVGRVAQIDAGRSVATFNINSHLELLDVQMPRNLYQPGCVNNLGDASCGVDIASFSAAGTVAAGSSVAMVLGAIAGTHQAGYFDLGTITFTSGVLNGQSFTVKQCTYGSPSTISLMGFSIAAPAAGDTFTIFAGCNKNCDLPISVQGIMTAGQNNLVLVNGSNGGAVQIGATITGYGVPAGTTVTSWEPGSGTIGGYSTTGNLYVSNNFTASSSNGASYISHPYVCTSTGVMNGCSKFANLANYRGFPYVPLPSTAS